MREVHPGQPAVDPEAQGQQQDAIGINGGAALATGGLAPLDQEVLQGRKVNGRLLGDPHALIHDPLAHAEVTFRRDGRPRPALPLFRFLVLVDEIRRHESAHYHREPAGIRRAQAGAVEGIVEVDGQSIFDGRLRYDVFAIGEGLGIILDQPHLGVVAKGQKVHHPGDQHLRGDRGHGRQ